MRIIVPMAGRGSRLRPHTLTVPKPLIPIAGKPIVHRLVEDIASVINQEIEEIAFIIHESFGKAVEADLLAIAEKLGSKGKIYYQNEALGTAHAILCAKESMQGNIVVAYADTLFRADFTLETDADSVIWVKAVPDPSAFGVVQLNDKNEIVDFVEKPKEFISDLAIIGIYYFKSGENLRAELEYLLDNNIIKGGEYQLTDALENMKQKGLLFKPGKVDEWMDCGNKNVTVETNSRMLNFLHQDGQNLVANNVVLENAKIIQPCYVGENVVLKNATIGPNVSVGANSVIENATINNSLIQNNATITNAQLTNSMIGNHAAFNGKFTSISIGDYSVLD
ncbi:nucleotidyltransferase [Flavobacterium agricola]|uniref:Nucleotidyltransferase n=1 Tax=Flavobacterium agricola TaxID=2870839 RepID=A0ABY6LXJ2_9FLAO|nr:sugar phosphate nucleotidyltransferase [Flavobacterium agricola]UYW00886.1 nucleotidyltransferase [Flavobacterium agricola]